MHRTEYVLLIVIVVKPIYETLSSTFVSMLYYSTCVIVVNDIHSIHSKPFGVLSAWPNCDVVGAQLSFVVEVLL